MNILFIDQNFDAHNIGGAFKSNYAIIREFRKNPKFNILVLATKSEEIRTDKFSVKKIRPVLKTPSKKINSLLKYFSINQYFSLFPILKEIRRFKPNIIVVQRDLSFSAILAAFLKKIPVINIIRDAMEFCPKAIDTRGFKNCYCSLTLKECWNCIYKWRSLRVLFEDKPTNYTSSLISSYHTIYYKIQYFLTNLYFFLIRYVSINVVASPQMRDLLKKRVKNIRIAVRKITPIDNTSNIFLSTNRINEEYKNIIENAKNIILFVLPRNEGGSKGYPFVKRLILNFPKEYLFVVVGTIIKELKEYENVLNIDKIPTNNLYYLYKIANITIVPSLYTEAFGRVVLESVINKTPVIVSPQTSANFLFKNKNYVKVLPLRVDFWISEIQKMINNSITIPDEDIKKIEKKFSSKACANDLLNLILKIKYL